METSNDTHTLHVSIVSPERKLFEGEAERIAVPGEMGRFEVRHNHAPIISTLTASNFNGDASDGYKVFYTQKVVPALTENLTAPQNSLMASLKDMLTGIETQLLDTVDPQLGENNKNPGAES